MRLKTMAWKEVNLAKWADDMGVDINEIDQKLKLREVIIKIRNKKGMSDPPRNPGHEICIKTC